MKTKSFLTIVAIYYAICSLLNLGLLIYTLFYRSMVGLEILVVLIACVYLLGIIITAIKVITGSTKAMNILKISVLLQVFFFQIGGFLFQIQNGAILNLYVFFHNGAIRYGVSMDYFNFAIEARITGSPINYVAINVIPIVFSLVYFFVKSSNPRPVQTSCLNLRKK
ncbi:MAG: hypothetical protein ACTHMI_12710 [Mucilaginibacter sp.]